MEERQASTDVNAFLWLLNFRLKKKNHTPIAKADADVSNTSSIIKRDVNIRIKPCVMLIILLHYI
ncbi:MAG: hypothetical protein ACRDDD_11680, partial [Plesiomonas sp.]|uniref:hypothetical protein n=1 Tax=Plesiomonas sp. TaxID=2486279 RepID=UPI003EE7CDAF